MSINKILRKLLGKCLICAKSKENHTSCYHCMKNKNCCHGCNKMYFFAAHYGASKNSIMNSLRK